MSLLDKLLNSNKNVIIYYLLLSITSSIIKSYNNSTNLTIITIFISTPTSTPTANVIIIKTNKTKRNWLAHKSEKETIGIK